MTSAWRPVANIMIFFLLLFGGLYAYRQGYLNWALHELNNHVKVRYGPNADAKIIMTSPVPAVITYDGYMGVDFADGTPTIHAYISEDGGWDFYSYMLVIPLDTSYRARVLKQFEREFHTTLPANSTGLAELIPEAHQKLHYDDVHVCWRHSVSPSETITANLEYFLNYYPPDVVLSRREGMCIEYAVLWAALYLAEGYNVTYVFIQGVGAQHGFIVNPDGIVIENQIYTRPDLSEALRYYNNEFGPLEVTEIVYAPNVSSFVRETTFHYG